MRDIRRSGLGTCHGTQVAADEIEQRVARWLQSPERAQRSSDAAFVLSTLKLIWPLLLPLTIRSLVQQLVWEVRWDASQDRVEVLLDDIAIHEQAEGFRRACRDRPEVAR